MEIRTPKYELIDYVFWVLFILYSNPGGILQAIGLLSKDGGSGSISFTDIIFVLLFGCFILISHKTKINNSLYKKTIKYFVFFGLYYFLVFGYFVPIFKLSGGHTFFYFIRKSRVIVYSFLFFVMVYHFYLRSSVLFFRILVLTSIIILSLFIVTIITGFDILPVYKLNRNFTKTERIFLYSYGFMPLLIPIGIIVTVFLKNKFKWKNLILLSFGLMFFSWLLSITRRHIMGTFIYLFIAIILFNYFQHKGLISFKRFFSVIFYVIIFVFIVSLSFPKYLKAASGAIEESISVIQSGESSSGSEDVRLGFGTEFMQDIIINNPFFGTGFDNHWRTKVGDELGYEAADYPLLGAIAMTGISGLLFFLPIYFLLIKSLFFDIKYLRKSKVNYHTMEFFGLIIFMLYFIYNLLQYMNWFSPVSLPGQSSWYIYLAMYFASRQLFYNSQKNKKEYVYK